MLIVAFINTIYISNAVHLETIELLSLSVPLLSFNPISGLDSFRFTWRVVKKKKRNFFGKSLQKDTLKTWRGFNIKSIKAFPEPRKDSIRG